MLDCGMHMGYNDEVCTPDECTPRGLNDVILSFETLALVLKLRDVETPKLGVHFASPSLGT